jgi:hypothetical protein
MPSILISTKILLQPFRDKKRLFTVGTTRGFVPAKGVYVFLVAIQIGSRDKPASYRMGTESFLLRDKTTEE